MLLKEPLKNKDNEPHYSTELILKFLYLLINLWMSLVLSTSEKLFHLTSIQIIKVLFGLPVCLKHAVYIKLNLKKLKLIISNIEWKLEEWASTAFVNTAAVQYRQMHLTACKTYFHKRKLNLWLKSTCHRFHQWSRAEWNPKAATRFKSSSAVQTDFRLNKQQ